MCPYPAKTGVKVAFVRRPLAPSEPNFRCNDILSYKSVLAICAARSILDLMTF